MITAKYCLVLMFASCCLLFRAACVNAAGTDDSSVDTLSLYNKASRIIHYNHPSITRQAARFELRQSARLQEISVLTNGGTGSFILRIWGHEGGSSAPSIGRDLTDPITVLKDSPGLRRITIPLENRNIILSNNQFFVVVEDLPREVQLISDSEEKQPSCISGNEKFVWQYLQGSSGVWQYGRFGFAVDAVVAYTNTGDISFDKSSIAVAHTSATVNAVNGNSSIACADINNDGFIDILANGRLFINRSGTLTDQTIAKGLSGSPIANCFIDIDNDGDSDILFIGQAGSSTSTSCILYVNTGEKFREVPLKLPVLDNPTSFSMADVNHDGYIDLFVGQSITPALPNVKNYLFINNAHLSFEDRTEEYFPSARGNATPGGNYANEASACKGSSFIDINGDNLPDLYIVNYYGRADELWVSRQGKSLIANEGLEKNLQEEHFYSYEKWSPLWYSSGGHWADVDGNGVLDLLTARYVAPVHNNIAQTAHQATGAVLYKQSDSHAVNPAVMSPFEYEEKQSSGVWGDVDNDGKVDCILFSPCKCRYADFYQQQKENNFTLVTAAAGLEGIDEVRDGVWVDINNDGLLDLACVRSDSLFIYINTSSTTNRYVSIELQPAALNKQAVGASVDVYSEDGIYTQQVITGRGLLMQDPARLHYGLGPSTDIDSVLVTWPSGKEEKFTDVVPNSMARLKENTGKEVVRKSRKVMDISVRPMPFRDNTELSFFLSEKAHVIVNIFTVEGSPIRKLANTVLETGEHRMVWDGRNEHGEVVSSGTYLYKCSVDGHEIVGKIIRID